MWIASKLGWFSIVLKGENYHIRARRKKDLENLLDVVGGESLPPIETWTVSDYRYRVRIPEASNLIGEVFAVLCCSVDYPNFKSMIAATPDQREKLHAYHEIWATMAALQK